MLKSGINLTGQIVAVRAKDSHILLAAKVVKSMDTSYSIEYAAGNTEIVKYNQISIAPRWLKTEWETLKRTSKGFQNVT